MSLYTLALFVHLVGVIVGVGGWLVALISARLGGRALPPKSLGRTSDWVHARLLRAVDAASEKQWEHCGMYAPTRWDPVSFHDYMTLEDMFRMPLRHLRFHWEQLVCEKGA
jgi:hypothetical protein